MRGGGELPLLLVVADPPQGRAGVQEVLGGVRSGAPVLDRHRPMGSGLGGLEAGEVPAAALAGLAVAGLHPAGAAGGGGAPVGAGGDGHLHHRGVQLGKDHLRLQDIRSEDAQGEKRVNIT